MKALKLKAVAALMAAVALSACGGGGGSDPEAGPPPPAAPAPVPAPGPVEPPPPPPPPAPAEPSAPVNRLNTGEASIVASGTLTFNGANGNLMTVDDADGGQLTTVLTVTAGTLAMSTGSGASITGDGTGEVNVVGSIAQINAALNGMVYSAPGSAQTVTLRILTEDDTAAAPLSDSDEVTITVTAAPPPQFQSFQAAVSVLGQADFNSASGGPPTARNVLSPRGAVAISASGRRYVPDTGHDRVLMFAAGAGAGSSAQLVFGQAGPTAGGARIEQGSHPQASHVAIAAGIMAVAEPFANRISLYSSVPTSTTALPNGLLGQSTFDATLQSCNLRTLNHPESVAITPDGGRFLVADTGNSRVTIYNQFPTAVGTAWPYSLTLGQTNSECVLEAVPSSATMNHPVGVWTDGTRVVVADTGNNRVLIWNTFPTRLDGALQRGEPAHLVLGQVGFDLVLPNRGFTVPSPDRLNAPTHVASDGTRLAVADTGNHRVLIWTTFPTTNGEPAQVVLGQSDFDKNVANDPDQDGDSDGPTSTVLSSPGGLHFHNGKLYVSDRGNNRILIFEPQ